MRQSQSSRRAFSLIELLVVIGIIGVLIAILVPTVSRVRTSANAANSQQVVSTLASAIERYYGDYRAYPGVFRDDDIRANTALTYQGQNLTGDGTAANNGSVITITENLTLALLGGLRWNNTGAGTFTYDKSLVGQGPISFANRAAIKQLPPAGTFKTNIDDENLGQVGANDTNIPEILDGFGGEQKPVLYMRARVGAGGIVTINGTDGALTGQRYQYERFDIAAYMKWLPAGSPDLDGLETLGVWADTVPSTGRSNALPYFRNPTGTGTTNATGTPRNKDGYLLIAPGKDRLYGTADDITNFGAVIP